MSAIGDQLQDALKQYELGINTSVYTSQQTGKMDQLAASVASEITTSIPGGADTVKAANGILQTLNSTFGGGPYSTVSRIGNDLASFNLGALWKDLGGTRTFNMDQYWGAVYYYRYVVGQNVSNQNQISDNMIVPALKWFIDKLGIYISGNEHIVYLNQSVDRYLSLAGVNTYTTTDRTRVQNAYNVLKTYWPYIETNPVANSYPGPPGAWANTVGVYDTALINLVKGSPAYQAALNAAKQGYTTTDILPGLNVSAEDITTIAIIAIVVLAVIYFLTK